MAQIYFFQIFYALMIAWGIYMIYKCAQQKHHLRNRVLVLYLSSTFASASYFLSTLFQVKETYDIFNSILFVFIDITLVSLLYYLVDFTSIGKIHIHSSLIKSIFFVVVGIDCLLNLTNPIHHLECEYTPYQYTATRILFETTRKPIYNIHLIISYILVVLCLDLLIKKCRRTPKAYRKRYFNILITLIIIILLNFIFLFTTNYLLFDISYLLYSLCAYSVYKNTFFFSNSQSMNNSKRIILEYLNSPIALFDYENILTDCNAIFLEVFPEIQNYHEIPISLNHFEDLSGLSLQVNSSNEIITKKHKRGDEILLYHCHLNAFHDNDGKFLGHILILNNVTREIAAIEAAENAGKAKSAFLASMSHEIRTPINAVLGMDELILRESNQPQIIEYATNISNAGKLLLTIINDILDISKMESGSMRIVPTDYRVEDLIRSLHAIIDLRAENKGLTMNYDIADNLPSVLCGDEMRIQQCITNLLTNAVKYTPSGGVTLSMSCERTGSEEILLRVAVNDSGIGIKPEDMNKLFTTFQRLDESRNRSIEGTGLGLHLTHKLIGLMGGKMKVESVYGVGSTFSFEILQKVIDSTPLQSMKTDGTSEHRKYQVTFVAPDANVLVVDDNKVNLAVFKGLLKNTKMKIDTALSGMETLEKVKSKYYDIIFLDHMMPEMDGLECLEEMKQMEHNLCKDSPVIALTANVYSGASLFYKEKGFADYLSKPIDAKALEETIIKYLPAPLVELNRHI